MKPDASISSKGLDEDLLWSGRPFPRFFWRPVDYIIVPNFVFFAGAALFIFRPFTLASLPIAAIILLVLLYGTWFRFLQDARLRQRTWYELRSSGLTVWRSGHDAPVCQIPLHKLEDVRPDWQNRSGISSIELPLGGREFAYSVFNEFDMLVPARNPCRRLELIENADEVARYIREIADRRDRGTDAP